MDTKTPADQEQQNPTTNTPQTVIYGPIEAWMEIPLVTVREITTPVDQEPQPQPQPQAPSAQDQRTSNDQNSRNATAETATTAGLRGGNDDEYDDCCEVCCSNMVICLRCWLCCGCHYDD
ncbi:hypothetical protein PG999_002691 [Apiospora kogelbergensis]|uniref:Cysteine-rich transmembrane CYSTM domain-containing protein n=1 Tax=Apiospora kogelbergensis TaxID=1337665 RepID=A0AAW0R951_9PEZI